MTPAETAALEFECGKCLAKPGKPCRNRDTGQDLKTVHGLRTGVRQVTLETSVVEEARKRVSRSFDMFDRVAVAFSGGKDSTSVLNLVLEEAARRGKKKTIVVFFDEEAIPPPTVEYVMRVRERADVDFRWVCAPWRMINGTCASDPYWYPWDPRCPEKWVRPMPDFAVKVADLPGFKFGPDLKDVLESHTIYTLWPLIEPPGKGKGSLGVFIGIRADESMRRMTGVMGSATDNWITKHPYESLLKVIFDWTTRDVWQAPRVFGWDYNRTYDAYEMLGMNRMDQRVAPPFGEQPMLNLAMWAELWPETWAKMSLRVPGAATAARLSKTAGYGFGNGFQKPACGWQEYIGRRIKTHTPENQRRLAKLVANAVKCHKAETKEPLPDDEPHPITGLCWRRIARTVLRGDIASRTNLRKLLPGEEWKKNKVAAAKKNAARFDPEDDHADTDEGDEA